MEKLENEIKYWREKAGMKMTTMSNVFEIPYRTIQNWENGTRKPPKYVEKLIIEKLKGMI